jgi:hypothetical protein
MGAISPFDSDFNESPVAEVIPPFWTIGELSDDQKVLDWTNNAYDVETKRINKYREQCLKHLALFIGKHYADQAGRSGFAEASNVGLGITSNKVSKLVVNHLYDLTVQRVSRITRNKPTVSINPANSEYGDKVAARVVKYWVDYLLYNNDFDRLVAECAQAAYIMGEAYVLSLWNPNKGEVHADWKKEEVAAKEEKRQPRLPLLDEEGNQMLGENGEPLWIEKAVYTGDVELKLGTPLNVIVQSCGDFYEAEYFFYEEYRYIDELKALYKDKKDQIKADGQDDGLDKWRSAAGLPSTREKNKVLVRHFYQKSSPFLASGRYVISTRHAVLENKPLPDRQSELPISRLTDIDIPGVQRGLSFYTHGKSINATINDLTSMARRNCIVMAHPRWVVPRGSLVKKDALGNDITTIEFTGPTPPRIEAPPPMSTELNTIRESLKQDLQTILGVFDISRGQVPPNIRSALALQLVDEQEDQRANSSVAKHAALIRDVIQKAIDVAAAYYEPDDKRLIPIVGRDNRYLLKDFNPSYLTKAYDIRVSNSSGLPTTKAARTEMLVELKKAFPTMLRDEQVAELLQFSDSEKFYDMATVAVRSAEAENEAILNQEAVEEPAPFENMVVHWTVHMREVQNRGFKTATPKEVQAEMIKHIMATEMLMLQMARKNPAYSLELVKLPQFPVFFDLSYEDRILMDRARSGNPLSLVEIAALEQAGSPAGAGIVPPPGGIPNPSAAVAGPLSQAVVPQSAPTPSMAPPPNMQPVAPPELQGQQAEIPGQ